MIVTQGLVDTNYKAIERRIFADQLLARKPGHAEPLPLPTSSCPGQNPRMGTLR